MTKHPSECECVICLAIYAAEDQALERTTEELDALAWGCYECGEYPCVCHAFDPDCNCQRCTRVNEAEEAGYLGQQLSVRPGRVAYYHGERVVETSECTCAGANDTRGHEPGCGLVRTEEEDEQANADEIAEAFDIKADQEQDDLEF